MASVKDVVVENLEAGDLVYTGPTRHHEGEWQKVRSVEPPKGNSRTYGIRFEGLTMERVPGTKMAVQRG
jgi:hypothetical protein